MPGAKKDGCPFEGDPVRAKLFQHGGGQAVRLPKAFRFEGAEVTVRREGAVILEPVSNLDPDRRRSGKPSGRKSTVCSTVIDSVFHGQFPDRDPPPMQERDWW
jgi:antitoxin VapB